MHMENMVLGIAFGTTVTCFRNVILSGYKGTYNQIKLRDLVDDEPICFPIKGNRFAQIEMENFIKIPGAPIAYWISNEMFNIFNEVKISKFAISDGQTKTGDNEKYLRCIWEVANINVEKDKWVLHAKGGAFRRWYGNLDTFIDWRPKSREHYRKDKVARIAPEYIWFREGLSWTLISSSAKHGFRLLPDTATFNLAAPSIFFDNGDLMRYILGYCNSKICEEIIALFNPTLNTNIGDVINQPIIIDKIAYGCVISIVNRCVNESKFDWDSFETSWDFQKHPLLPKLALGSEAVFIDEKKKMGSVSVPDINLQDEYERVKEAWEKNFLQLKANEEELNRIFIDIYGLQDELTPDVEDKDVTVHRIYDSKEDVPESMKGSSYVLTKQDVVKSLISYAVGCMFGRYSLDKEGLVYAGGDWDDSNYVVFPADKDAIIPICDDEYFNDDIVARFVEFIKVVYGESTLEENLIFIAEALGGNGSAREVIRAYFINGFYTDHCKTYQKRPIYWLFDSGKKNGFKCLIYMHRYHKDTVARVRTDYLHEQQSRYRTNIEDLKNRINNATSTGMRVKLEKQLVALEAQAAEAFAYEEKMKHLADQMLEIDLDDGVKHNYAIFQDVLAKIK